MAALRHLVFELVDRIAAAETVAEVWHAYLGVAQNVGLPYAICLIPGDNFSTFQLLSEALPRGCLEGYRENGLAAGDMVMERARGCTLSFEWRLSDWDKDRLTVMQQRWREHCRTFGLCGGLCVMDFRKGQPMLLVLCGHDGVLDHHDRLALFFSGQEALGRIRDIMQDDLEKLITLSRRERECLQWVAAGKTDWEVGQILSLSEKAVNVYIERAKLKLGAKSRAKAIILASRAGIIAA